jgi:cyanophycin synthetase
MTKRNIEFLRLNYLRGPNIWTYRPVLEAWVDIGDLEDAPSNTIPGFYERLTQWLPSLVEHHCGVGERGGFLLRLREGTWAGHILEHVTIELQNLAGMQAGFGKARSTSRRGVYKVVVRARQEAVSRACMEAARELVLAAIDDVPFDVAGTVARLRDLADSLCLGPSTSCIVLAAAERGIPSIRLTEGNLVQLGYGAAQHRIWTAETDKTSAIAESISGDKDLTKRLLASCGVPVPEGQIVSSAAEAWDAAEDIGVPVVVKPTDANHGRGVSLDLRTRAEVEAAYAVAEAEGSEVMVERLIPGDEHRFLVVGNQLVAAASGESAWVVGDGKSTLSQLIDNQINTDPRRGLTEDFPLNKVLLHEDAAVRLELERQGLSGDSVPAAGRKVLIQRNGNVSVDVTDQVHPQVAAAACLAARVVGLDIAGVDLVAEDISRPLAAQGGAIVEVNAGPGLLMHLKPSAGKPRPVGEAIVASLFGAEESGRIPVVGISGSKGKTATARLLVRLLGLAGQTTGLACSSGTYFGKRQVETRDGANWQEAQRILMNPAITAAVIENGPRVILDQGLAYDRCQVGVVTDLDVTELYPDFYIETEEQLFNVLRTQVDVVLPGGYAVLNADDANVARMAELSDGKVVFFSTSASNSHVIEQKARGERAVYVQDQQIILAHGDQGIPLSTLQAIPLIAKPNPALPLSSLLAAIAAAWALDLSQDIICAGIQTYTLA